MALGNWSTHKLTFPDELELELNDLRSFGVSVQIDDHLGIIYLILRPGHIHTLSYS